MKLYTYNNLEAEYTELDKRTLINLLIVGERRNIYVSLSEDNTNDRYYFNRAKDKDIKEYLKGYTIADVQQVNITMDANDVKKQLELIGTENPWVIPNSSLTISCEGVSLNHDIVIGINKDLELPTVFIDGEKVEDGMVALDLRWETRSELPKPKSFRLNTRTKQNEEKRLMIKYEN